MKKINPIALVLVLLFFISCQDKGNKGQEKEPMSDMPNEKPGVKAPNGIIEIKDAKFIYDNYTEHRAGIIEQYEQRTRQGEGFEVARYADFDYETIKQYLDYIDQEAEKAGVEKVTKLRIYFANYPDKPDFAGKKVIHPRQNTVFMVPTLEESGQNYGFFIGANGKAELIKNVTQSANGEMGSLDMPGEKSFAGFAPKLFMSPNYYQGSSLTLNHSSGGPPPFGDF